jgi:ribonuclease P protein subunit RPR2
MAKQKAPAVVNRHIYARASYLFQAANYLADVSHQTQHDSTQANETHQQAKSEVSQNLSRQLASDLKLVCQKSVIRQSPDMKRSICKFCNTTLIEGQTSRSIVENPSKGSKKPWADLLAIHCLTCGNSKRYPVAVRKQKRKHLRPEPSNRNAAQEGRQGAKDAERQQRFGASYLSG